MTENYQRQLEALLAKLAAEGRRPRLLLHACCAPCSSYCVPYLAGPFDTTVYFYNPNIAPKAEYDFRLSELRRLLAEMPLPAPVAVQEGPYDPQSFLACAAGHEADPEPGERCRACYELRLRSAARAAREGGYDWFCTTLSISPHKRADWLNTIGSRVGAEEGVPFLPSDFKKNGGYAKSIVLSKKYNLYRQDYCGCIFSRAEAERRRAGRAAEKTADASAGARTEKTSPAPAEDPAKA